MSLIEVLVAMFILAVAALGTAPMFALSIDANKIGDDYSLAASEAASTLEQIQADGVTGALPTIEEEENLLGRFVRTIQIVGNETDTMIPENLARIEVTMAWTDKDGYLRTTVHRTLVERES